MIFSVSNDGIELYLDFGPDSVTLTVKDLTQELTISSQENPLTAWSLLSQIQEILNNHLARVPITPNQEGTIEIRDVVLSSVGVQDMDTRGYQVSDLEDNDFHWENPELNMDAAFRPGIDTLFSTSTLNEFQISLMAENSFLIDDSKTRTLLSIIIQELQSPRDQPSPLLMRSRAFGTRIENVPHLFIESCLNNLHYFNCKYFNKNYKYRVSFHQNFSKISQTSVRQKQF